MSLGVQIVSEGELGAANLLDHHIDLIAVLHVEVLRGLVLVETLSVEEEPHVGGVQLHFKGLTLCR